ncbi:MAG: extradiol dioxygenase, partial [Alphaproteobacteria bacterium]
KKGYRLKEVPGALTPGMDRNVMLFDPDGHALQLYYYMEQVGWDAKPCPARQRPKVTRGKWPDSQPELPDSYRGEPFLGPWN